MTNGEFDAPLFGLCGGQGGGRSIHPPKWTADFLQISLLHLVTYPQDSRSSMLTNEVN